MVLDSNTLLSDILKKYPWMEFEAEKVDKRLKLIRTPIGKMMIRGKSIKDASELTGYPPEYIIDKLEEIIDSHDACDE